MGATLLIQEIDEINFRATSLVSQWLVLVVLREELDSWKAADFVFFSEVCVLLRVAIDICDDTLFSALHS